jgi:hypothetical protein
LMTVEPLMPEELHIVCVDCGAVAPETDTAYTLIGQRYGWRVIFVVDQHGKRSPEWRCDKCFRRAKAERTIK